MTPIILKWEVEKYWGQIPQGACLNKTSVNIARHQYSLAWPGN